MRKLPIPNTADAEHEPKQSSIAVERAGSHAADTLTHHQDGGGDDVEEVLAPHVPLEADARFVIVAGVERAKGDIGRVGHSSASPVPLMRRRVGVGASHPARHRNRGQLAPGWSIDAIPQQVVGLHQLMDLSRAFVDHGPLAVAIEAATGYSSEYPFAP